MDILLKTSKHLFTQLNYVCHDVVINQKLPLRMNFVASGIKKTTNTKYPNTRQHKLTKLVVNNC